MNDDRWARIIDSWGTRRPLSEHLQQELAGAVHAGHRPGNPPPLQGAAPVPGCPCPRCATYAAGGDEEDADVAAFVVRSLADRPPQERLRLAEDLIAVWGEVGSTLPRPGVLAELAKRVPGAVRSLPDDADPLPVEEARRTPILDVTRRLGLGEPVRPYPSSHEYRVRCPLHPDDNPSLTISPDKGIAGLAFCFVCFEGGDGIWLVMESHRLEFHEAVKWIAETY